MKRKLLIVAGIVCFSNFSFSQFIVKDAYFESMGVSNQGKVVGYGEWGGPFSIWTPETQAVDTIYGLAPGNGIGGRANFSADGNYLSGTSMGTIGSEMSRFSVASDSWTTVGNFGFTIDNAASSGYAISGDGNSVAGSAWMDTNNTGGTAVTHATVWNQTEGIMDLGSLFLDKSTRINAISNDGAVAVGWQDFNGPWKAAVWRKNPAGGYFPNQYVLLDPTGSATDEYNQMGEGTAVSNDGNWIGGAGDFANNGNPWIWSQTTGVVDLGTLSPGGSGYVAAINEDGTMAVGRIQVGSWDPELPFIWTPTGGIQNLNDYATNVMGIDLGTKQIYSANCMSLNGDYIAGYGVDNETFAYFTYRLSIATAGISENEKQAINIYPNPATDILTIENIGESALTITNIEGKIIHNTTINGTQKIDVSAFESGVYFLSLISINSGNTATQKFLKK